MDSSDSHFSETQTTILNPVFFMTLIAFILYPSIVLSIKVFAEAANGKNRSAEINNFFIFIYLKKSSQILYIDNPRDEKVKIMIIIEFNIFFIVLSISESRL
jgi:hypothetical protein